MIFEKTRTTPPIVHPPINPKIGAIGRYGKNTSKSVVKSAKSRKPDGGVEPPTLRLRVSRSTD